MMNGRVGLAMVLTMVGVSSMACDAIPLDPNVDGGGEDTAGSGALSTGGTPSTGGVSLGSGGVSSGGTTGSNSGGTNSSSSHPGQSASGTVSANIFVGPATASCPQNLRLANPGQPMTGYLIMAPATYQNDPRAGLPSYIYLDAGKDAVSLPGPTVAYGDSPLETAGAKLTTCLDGESACLGRDGYRVEVNAKLAFVIGIDDWEDEIALGQVDLCLNAGTLSTQFVFAGIGGYLGGGVAHRLTISAISGGTSTPATSPVSIECR